MRTSRLHLVAAVLAVIVLASCGDDDAATTTTTTVVSTTATDPTTTATSSTTAHDDVLADAETCTSPDGFTISYPGDWDAVADCGQFGPAPLEEPTRGTDERPGVISAYVDPVPFEEVSTPAPDVEQERTETEVDGHPAVRTEAVASGEGLYPAGTETVRWMIDLSAATDGSPRTMFVNAVDIHDAVDFDQAVDVLDAMVRSVEIEQQSSPPTGDEPD